MQFVPVVVRKYSIFLYIWYCEETFLLMCKLLLKCHTGHFLPQNGSFFLVSYFNTVAVLCKWSCFPWLKRSGRLEVLKKMSRCIVPWLAVFCMLYMAQLGFSVLCMTITADAAVKLMEFNVIFLVSRSLNIHIVNLGNGFLSIQIV